MSVALLGKRRKKNTDKFFLIECTDWKVTLYILLQNFPYDWSLKKIFSKEWNNIFKEYDDPENYFGQICVPLKVQ